MLGLAAETVCMDVEEAKKYVESRINDLEASKAALEARLQEVEMDLEAEYSNLCMLNNPPSKAKCIDCGIDALHQVVESIR